MTAETGVVGNVLNDNGFMAEPDFVANRRFELEFTSGFQAEGDLVARRTANPMVLSNAGDGSKAHTGRTAHNLKDAGYGIDTLYRVDVRRKIVHHQKSIQKSQCKVTD